MSELENATGIVKWWKELTLLGSALIALLFGIRRSTKKDNLVTDKTMEAEMRACVSNLKDFIRTENDKIYRRMDERIDHLSDRFDKHLENNK